MADDQENVKPGEEGADTTDWKAMARKWEARSKENADKARSYDELQEQSDELSAKAKRDATRAKVAKDTGVPAELISGDDEESMRAFAEAVAKWGKPSSAPRTRKPGSFSADAGDGRDAARRELARQLFGSGE